MKKGILLVFVLSIFAISPLFAGEHGGKEHAGSAAKEQGGTLTTAKTDAQWLNEAADVLAKSHPEHASQLKRIASELEA